MPESHEPKSSAPAPTSTRGELTLSVYHRSADVERHIALLGEVPHLRLLTFWQGTTWTLPPGIAGVLWELTPQDSADPRLAAMLGQTPAASYSLSSTPAIIELSRALGFKKHLTAPLRLVEVERALGLPAVVDLADRLEAAGPRLTRLANQTAVSGELMRAVNASSDPHGVASALIFRVEEWLPLTSWAVLVVEPDGVMRRLDDREPEPGVKSAGDEIADIVVRSGRAALRSTSFVTDRLAAGAQPLGPMEGAALGWPLVAAGEVVGVLVGFDHGRARRMPVLSAELADAFSRLIEPAAFALAHTLRVARAEALSVTDDLTQLFNSRFLNDALRKEAKRAMRSGSPLSLLFIDLDGFKKINDAHGHLLGSRALIEAAAVIRGSARETDIVARFGGDEFAILLPETGVEGAQAVARRLRDRIARYVFLADRSPDNRLTASIGLATLPDVADTAEGLLQAADAAMYRVKMSGKNGIHIAGSERDAPRVPEEEQELR